MGENFTKRLAESLQPYEGASASSDTEEPCALARLLISCNALPNLSDYNGKMTMVEGPDNLYILQFYDPADALKCKIQLQNDSSVRYVEQDFIMRAIAAEQGTSSSPHRSWGASKAGISEYAANLRQRGNAQPVIVAIVDSGVEKSHPFLQDRLMKGYDFIEYDDVPQDENGHGTHVAGTVADCTPGMDVKIMPVRVLNAFASGSYLSIANGIRYAADHGANIINLSLGSTKHSHTIDDAVNYALSKNITVVVAAGNKQGDVDYFCPAHMEDCITVTAVDSNFNRFELSNYGEAVDIAAPGVDIISSIRNGKYDKMSGTSMATPHVSAAAALLMSERGTGQTPFQISSLLRDAATDLGEPGKDVYFGAGFLNMRPFIVHSAYAMLYADGELVFQKNNTPASDRELVKSYPVATSGDGGGQYAAWHERHSDIRKVTFAESIRPTSTALWFYGCENLTEIRGLENLDASELTDMSQMFARCGGLKTLDLSGLDTGNVSKMNSMFFHCEGLTELDLTGWNTKNVTDTRDMFIGCAALKTVYASDSFSAEKIADSEGMFQGCYALVGGRNTPFDNAHTDKGYARIDNGSSAPGYFTDKNAPIPSTDIYAVLYGDGELVFQNNNRTDSGRTVTDVYKVDKKYSLSFPPWYEQRENITTVIFADKIQPTSTAHWFVDCENLTNIRNISNLYTSNVTDMSWMFMDCVSLSVLDLSSFDTSNVTDMNAMFYYCSGLTSLDVSGFDTSNVTYMLGMFRGCSRLSSLDLSGFDTRKVTRFGMYQDDDGGGWGDPMFGGCANLKTIYASENFVTSQIESGEELFDGCLSLVGGAGTTYSDDRTDIIYARIDGGTSAPGYFTNKHSTRKTPTVTIGSATVTLSTDSRCVISNVRTLDANVRMETLTSESGNPALHLIMTNVENDREYVVMVCRGLKEGEVPTKDNIDVIYIDQAKATQDGVVEFTVRPNFEEMTAGTCRVFMSSQDDEMRQIATFDVADDNGATVGIPISVQNMARVGALRIQVTYPKDALVIKNVTDNKIFKDQIDNSHDKSNPVTILWSSALEVEGVTYGGELCTINFDVLNTAKAGTYDIAVAVLDASDAEMEDIHFDTVNGALTISR